MALVTCPDCGRQVAETAVSCPQCGARNPGAGKATLVVSVPKGFLLFAIKVYVVVADVTARKAGLPSIPKHVGTAEQNKPVTLELTAGEWEVHVSDKSPEDRSSGILASHREVIFALENDAVVHWQAYNSAFGMYGGGFVFEPVPETPESQRPHGSSSPITTLPESEIDDAATGLRMRNVGSKKEFESVIENLTNQGYEILNREESTALMRRKSWGSVNGHILCGLLTVWCTFGFGNLAYALFSHFSAEQLVVKIDTGAPDGMTTQPLPQSTSMSSEHRGTQEISSPIPTSRALPGNVILNTAKDYARKAKQYAGSEEVKDAVDRAKMAAASLGERAMKPARGAMDDKTSQNSDVTTTGQTTSTSIRDNLVVVALSMMCCGPLGLFLVWTNPRWSKFQKVAWSLLMLPMLMIGSCIQEQKVQEVVRSLVEGDRLWDAGSRDEAADRYRKAWKDHREILTGSTDSTKEVIRPHLPNLYARLMVYELSKGRRDEARQLSEQAIKDKIELTLETAEARDFHKIHMPNNSIADAPQQGRANGEVVGGRGGQSDSTGDSSAKLSKGYFTDSWDYKNGCQVIFEKTVTSSEARKLGDYLRSREFFDNDPVTFQIGKPGKTYEFRVVIKKGLEQDQDTIDGMNQLGREISRSVFGGSPIDVHLCDDRMKTIRVIVP